MGGNTQPSTSSRTTDPTPSFWGQRMVPWMPTNWRLANDGTKVVATAFALAPLTAFQTALQTRSQLNTRLPIAGILMKTVGENLKMHTSRGTVSVTGKGHNSNSIEEPSVTPYGLPRVATTFAWTLGDDFASTYHGAKGKFKAAGILPHGYKAPSFGTWFYNYRQTMAVGTPLRMVIGFSNLSFLFYGADYFTGKFHSPSPTLNNALGGATAGAAAAVATGALKGLYDNQLQKTTLDENTGRIKTMNTFRFFEHHAKRAASMPLKDFVNQAATRALKDIAHTGGRNMLIFGGIQTVLHALGSKPFANIVPEPTAGRGELDPSQVHNSGPKRF